MSEPEDDDTGRRPGNGEAAALEPKGLEAVEPPATELEALRKERDELRDQLLRRRAEFENYKKRVERDRSQAGVDASAGVLRALLPIIDNFDRALHAGGSEDTLREGVGLIYRELLALLESQGVVVQDPVGERFDPENHQALSHEVSPGHEEGTVVEVFRKGYLFKDRLLRPALVKVAKGEDRDGGPEAVH